METITQCKETIKKAIADGPETGLKFMDSLLDRESLLFSVFDDLKKRFDAASVDFARGLIDAIKKKEVEDQVTHGLLFGIVDKLVADDIVASRRPSDDKSAPRRTVPPFDLKFPRYKLDVLRLDRNDAAAIFKHRFKVLEKEKTQHYFVHGDRHQQPGSFAERMIFELETTSHLLDYEAEGDKHIALRELDLAGNLEVSKLRLCEYFEERFGGSISWLWDVEKVFAPSDRYPYVVTVLRMHVEDWQPHTANFFKWFLNDFCQTDPANPTRFLFFYIIQKDTSAARAKRSILSLFGGKPSQEKQAEAWLNSLHERPNCTVFPELKPISLHDLIKWLSNFISNQSVIDQLLKEILSPEKYGDQFDLSLVEHQLLDFMRQRQALAS